MRIKYKYFYTLIIIFLFSFSITLAETTPNAGAPRIEKGLGGFMRNLEPTASKVGYNLNAGTPEAIIGQIISLILSFLGILFLILTIVSGIQWMTAGGNEETIDKSKQRIKNAAFGLAIVLAAYAITIFITSLFIDKTGFTQ